MEHEAKCIDIRQFIEVLKIVGTVSIREIWESSRHG